MESSTLVSELYRSRINLLDIMNTQNYNITDQTNFSFHEINEMYSNDCLDFELIQNETNKKAFIKYWLTTGLKPSKVHELIEELYISDRTGKILEKTDTLIIIVKDEPNDTLKELIKFLYETENIFIVVHNIKRLLFNILKHQAVPPCRILSNEEVEQVKRRYNISDNLQFPKLSRFDPQALAICFRPGEIIELIRSSKTSCVTKYYRICVNETTS
jgi:DNA-directed RNA polymerase subunit H (RpoH/RPB5)